jgi:urease accessory protein
LLAQGRDADGLADFAYALAITAERRTEMHDQGAAFGQLIEALTGTTQPPLPYALAIGHASRALTVPTQDVVMFFLQSLAAQLISVAVRFMPMGASQGQKLLQQLSALIAVLAQDFAKTPLCDLSNATLGADLAAMRHETMDVRIFRS